MTRGLLMVLLCAWVIVTPGRVVAESAKLEDADALINQAIAQKRCPGAVLLVGQNDAIVYRKAYGDRSVEPKRVAETPDTIFDLASLTKSVATGPSIMILVDDGKLKLADKVSKYFPQFKGDGKETITIEQLLLHISGLTPDNAMSDYADGPEAAWKAICQMNLDWNPGEKFAYSDMGYIVLGKLVEKVSGMKLDEFAQKRIYEPLKMDHTGYLPPQAWRGLIAPTAFNGDHWLIGEVHDPRASALGGVAGHAGVFSDADDLSRFCRMLLHEGTLDGRRILKAETVREMIRPHGLPGDAGSRGLGFDIDTAYSHCRGERFPAGTTFGHTGFTGTMFWIDPPDHCYLILLTNSVHPNGHGNILQLRHDVATTVGEALLDSPPAGKPDK